jgi:hypothetical protein
MYGYGPWAYRQRMGCRGGACAMGCVVGALFTMIVLLVVVLLLLAPAPGR